MARRLCTASTSCLLLVVVSLAASSSSAFMFKTSKSSCFKSQSMMMMMMMAADDDKNHQSISSNSNRRMMSVASRGDVLRRLGAVAAVLGGGLSTSFITSPLPLPASAIKSSSFEEAKAAALTIKQCLKGLDQMQKAAGSGDWQQVGGGDDDVSHAYLVVCLSLYLPTYIHTYLKVGDILSQDIYRKFDTTATVLVRSDKLTAEDKVALGTIKRFGKKRIG